MTARTSSRGILRRAISGACVAVLAVSASVASAQVWLLDFGGSNSYRGASQVGLDANGNQWNSMPPTFYTANLRTTSGSSTAAYAPISGSPGTDSFNGPLGAAVSNPLTQAEVDAALIDAAALGLLGGSKAAVVDYQSATLNVGGGGNYNQSRTIMLAGLAPTATDAAGRQLSFQFGGASGTTTGYLNAMSLYGYLGSVNGGTTTLAANPAYIATGMGTYANGDSRSVDTVLGGGSTLNVTGGVGTYWNSTLVVNPSGGSLAAGVNVAPYRLAGAGTLGVSGTGGLSLSRPGTFSGTVAVNGGLVVLSGSGALGSGGLALNGGTVRISNPQAVGAGGIAVVSGNTTIENSSGIDGLSGSLPISLGGGAATLKLANVDALRAAVLSAGTTQTVAFTVPGVNTYNLGGLTWLPGGTFVWEVNDLGGAAGTNWDSVAVSGAALDISGLSASAGGQFVLDLVTLTGANAAGPLGVEYVAGTTYEFGLASYAIGLAVPSGFTTTAGVGIAAAAWAAGRRRLAR